MDAYFDEYDDSPARLAACKRQRANGGFPVRGVLPLSPVACTPCTDEPAKCYCGLSYHSIACNLGVVAGGERVRVQGRTWFFCSALAAQSPTWYTDSCCVPADCTPRPAAAQVSDRYYERGEERQRAVAARKAQAAEKARAKAEQKAAVEVAQAEEKAAMMAAKALAKAAKKARKAAARAPENSRIAAPKSLDFGSPASASGDSRCGASPLGSPLGSHNERS